MFPLRALSLVLGEVAGMFVRFRLLTAFEVGEDVVADGGVFIILHVVRHVQRAPHVKVTFAVSILWLGVW